MRSPRFEAIRIFLSALGAFLLGWIGLRLALSADSTAAQAIGWGLLILLALGLIAMLRPRKLRQ